LSAIILSSNFARADGYQQRYGGPPPFSWSGMYIGYHVGGALGKSDVSDPFVGPAFATSPIFCDKRISPGPFPAWQIGVTHEIARSLHWWADRVQSAIRRNSGRRRGRRQLG